MERELERCRAPVDEDVLALKCREYDDLAQGLVAALQPELEAWGNPVAAAALETLRRLDRGMTAGCARAGSRTLATTQFRLIVEESREAWEVLRHLGLANGAPHQMIRRLLEIGRGILPSATGSERVTRTARGDVSAEQVSVPGVPAPPRLRRGSPRERREATSAPSK